VRAYIKQKVTAAKATLRVFSKKTEAEVSGTVKIKEEAVVPQTVEARTFIVAMNQSVRGMNGLVFTVKSILNEPQFKIITEEVISYLTQIAADDSYDQIYKAMHEYLLREIDMENASSAKKALFIAALNRLQQHFIQTCGSKYAYNPNSKPNPQAVYYPNPSYNRSLYDEMPYVKKEKIIDEKTVIGVIGDSAAMAIANALKLKNYYIHSLGMNDGLNEDIKRILSPSVLRKTLEAAFGLNDQLPQLFFPYVDQLRRLLTISNVLLITFHSTEIDFSHDSGIKDDNMSLSIKDTMDDLQRIFNIAQAISPTLKIILSISTTPLISANEKENNIVTRSSLVKSVLRVAIEDCISRLPGGVFYFPAYETVIYSTKNPFKEDMSDISEESDKKLNNLFEIMYL